MNTHLHKLSEKTKRIITLALIVVLVVSSVSAGLLITTGSGTGAASPLPRAPVSLMSAIAASRRPPWTGCWVIPLTASRRHNFGHFTDRLARRHISWWPP